jgi:putative oxygen-independent coproporphyrinogen III oxidase
MSDDIHCGFYIHVPFCQRKCPYCDFYSTTDISLIPRWMEALKSEADFYPGRFPSFDTLYLGGGSPSRLSEKQIEIVFKFIQSRFPFNSGTEITIESNPIDLNPSRLRTYRDLGVNRISLGIQSFNDQELSFLRRNHTAQDAQKALEWIREAGFTNLGIDLIYGLPGQTKDQWLVTLKKALAFQPEHLSCYQLTIARGTLFGGLKEKGRLQPITETDEEIFFLTTSQFLEYRGYIHYEISSFARDEKYFSRHNQKYWQREPYLGLGPSAHSFQENRRWWNVRSLNQYCRALEGGKLPIEDEEELTQEQVQMEWISLGLRTRTGLDLTLMGDKLNSEKILPKFIENGWGLVTGNYLVPTLKGFLVADRLPLLFD